MNDFIVWDSKNKKFPDVASVEFGVTFYKNLTAIWRKPYKDEAVNWISQRMQSKYTTIHNYIGKTDINGKKIYADCSIVEFDCKIWGTTIEKPKGYFEFNKDTLRYVICAFSNSGIRRIAFDNEYVKNLKIIDTIQEREARNVNTEKA